MGTGAAAADEQKSVRTTDRRRPYFDMRERGKGPGNKSGKFDSLFDAE
jgi:hypothetical protein